MANIDQYLAEIRSAIYGEEVRGSIINALEAQNNETENNTTAAEQAVKDVNEAISNAENAAEAANTAAAGADASGENAVKIATEAAENATQTASDAAAEAVEIAQTAADSATQTAGDAADEAVRIATEAAETAQSTADAAAENANTAANAANAAALTQIESYDITYQASSIGTEPPTGEWIHSIPQVTEGNYLWTRVIIYDVAGNETTFYSVGKMGSSSGGEGGGNLWYGLCESSGTSSTKMVVCDGFSLDTGVEIVIKFSYTNTASNAMMNVNETGEYPIYYNNSNISSGLLRESGTYFFVFDGSHYAVVGELSGAAIDELKQDVAQINEDLTALNILGQYGTTISSGSDLNNFTTPGKYQGAANSVTNSPTTNGFILYVMQGRTANALFQIFIPGLSNIAIYVRYYSSGSWYDWYKLARESDLDQINTSLSELQKDTADITDDEINALFE